MKQENRRTFNLTSAFTGFVLQVQLKVRHLCPYV